MLIQDFHFALLPRLLRERKPEATIALFWHIPWPNAETFGVCPWKRELLHAHAERRHPRLSHALSLPELPGDGRSVRRMPDRSRAHDGHAPGPRLSRRRPIPISIEWPPRWLATQSDVPMARDGGAAPIRHRPRTCASDSASSAGTSPRASSSASWRSRSSSRSTRSGAAASRLLQVAAPSRSKLPAYQALQQQTLAEAERINEKFGQERLEADRPRSASTRSRRRCSSCTARRTSASSTACTTA